MPAPATVGGEHHVLVTRYLRTYLTDLNKTWHKYLALLHRFSRSRGQRSGSGSDNHGNLV